MTVVAAAIIGSTVVGGATAIASSSASAKAAKKGAEAETAMASENLALQREMAEQQRADFAPWRDAGEQALTQIESGIASGEFTMDNYDFTADPGYQFRRDQGIEARDKSAAARGRLLSGAQQKGIEEYGQGFASNEYANAYAREEANRTKKYNILSNVSGAGQSSAAGQAQATSNLASTSGNIMANTGRSQNIAQQNIGAARAGAYEDAATAANTGAQNWLLYKALGK